MEESTNVREPRLEPTILSVAIEILGKEKVITSDENHKTFNLEPPGSEPTVRYTEATLGQCATENLSGNSDWRLTNAAPLSFTEQCEIIGVNSGYQLYFDNYRWWVELEDSTWKESRPEAGYYLIDFTPRMKDTNWPDQERAICLLGNEFERADERVISQALLTTKRVTGEILLEGWCHWGQIITQPADNTHPEYHIAVGNLVGGIYIGHYSYDPWILEYLHTYEDDLMRVCVSRKFEF